MVNWVMVGRLAGMGHIYTLPINTNSSPHIPRGKVAGLFRPRSTSTIINSYITPQVTIIPPITIITTYITLLKYMTTLSTSLIFMNTFIYMMRSK